MPADITQPLEDGPISPPKSPLDIIERLAKIFAIVAIPVVIPIALAIYGGRVQQSAQRDSINRDYVQLSVSILKEKKDETNEGLRDWAADLLAAHSPTRMPPYVVEALKRGQGLFAPPGPNLIAISPDAKYLASSDGMGVGIWDVSHNTTLSIADTVRPVTALEFSPDSSELLTGFADGTVDIGPTVPGETRARTKTLRTTGPISAIKMPSRDVIYVFSQRDGLSVWDAPTGRLISKNPVGGRSSDNDPSRNR